MSMTPKQTAELKRINQTLKEQREKLRVLQAELEGTEEGGRITVEIEELVTVSVELTDIAGGE